MPNLDKKQQLLEIKEHCAIISHSIEQRFETPTDKELEDIIKMLAKRIEKFLNP